MRLTAIASILALVSALGAWAEVVDAASSGFTVRTVLTIQAAPETVYHKLVHNVGDWWSSQHTFSHDAHNLSLEDKIMGCFCEKLPNGGGVRHMEVVHVAPGKSITLTGALGPLQSIAATGNMTIEVTPAEGATRLQLTYSVLGYQPAGMNTWAAPVDSVLKEQLTRFKNYVETGNPVANPK